MGATQIKTETETVSKSKFKYKKKFKICMRIDKNDFCDKPFGQKKNFFPSTFLFGFWKKKIKTNVATKDYKKSIKDKQTKN